MSRSRTAGCRIAGQGVDEQCQIFVGERVQHDVGPPLRVELQQLGSRQADDKHRDGADRSRKGSEELEQQRLGRMDVVDDDDERLFRGACREEGSNRPGRLGWRRCALCETKKLSDQRHDFAAGEVRFEQRKRLVPGVLDADSGELAYGLNDRPVRDALAV